MVPPAFAFPPWGWPLAHAVSGVPDSLTMDKPIPARVTFLIGKPEGILLFGCLPRTDRQVSGQLRSVLISGRVLEMFWGLYHRFVLHFGKFTLSLQLTGWLFYATGSNPASLHNSACFLWPNSNDRSDKCLCCHANSHFCICNRNNHSDTSPNCGFNARTGYTHNYS